MLLPSRSSKHHSAGVVGASSSRNLPLSFELSYRKADDDTQHTTVWPSPPPSLDPVLPPFPPSLRNMPNPLASGPRTHALNATLGSVLLLGFLCYAVLFRRPAPRAATTSLSAVLDASSSAAVAPHGRHPFTMLSAFCVLATQAGLVFDNGVNGLGAMLGKGRRLRWLAKLRFAFHAAGMPLLLLPTAEIARVCLPGSALAVSAAAILPRLAMAWSLGDLVRWVVFCDSTTDLRLVDMRRATHHEGLHLPGTLKYTSDRVLELVLPALLVVLGELAVGISILWSAPATGGLPWSGLFLCASGALTLLSSALGPKRPRIQLYGENLHNSLVWAALVSMPAP